METLAVALRVLLSLAVVLGLLWLLHRRLSRGTHGKRKAEPLAIVGRQNLGQKASVVVVDVDGRRFLLGVTEQSVNVLHSAELNSADLDRIDAPAGAFDRAMAAALTAEPTGEPEVERELAAVSALKPRRNAPANSRLAGSILSPATWTQAATALRQVK